MPTGSTRSSPISSPMPSTTTSPTASSASAPGPRTAPSSSRLPIPGRASRQNTCPTSSSASTAPTTRAPVPTAISVSGWPSAKPLWTPTAGASRSPVSRALAPHSPCGGPRFQRREDRDGSRPGREPIKSGSQTRRLGIKEIKGEVGREIRVNRCPVLQIQRGFHDTTLAGWTGQSKLNRVIAANQDIANLNGRGDGQQADGVGDRAGKIADDDIVEARLRRLQIVQDQSMIGRP